jgi:hypothetical protein
MRLLSCVMFCGAYPHFCSTGKKRSAAIGFDYPQTIELSGIFSFGVAVHSTPYVMKVSNFG